MAAPEERELSQEQTEKLLQFQVRGRRGGPEGGLWFMWRAEL